jgi:hypothetical protein
MDEQQERQNGQRLGDDINPLPEDDLEKLLGDGNAGCGQYEQAGKKTEGRKRKVLRAARALVEQRQMVKANGKHCPGNHGWKIWKQSHLALLSLKTLPQKATTPIISLAGNKGFVD